MTSDQYSEDSQTTRAAGTDSDHSAQSWGDFLLDRQDIWESGDSANHTAPGSEPWTTASLSPELSALLLSVEADRQTPESILSAACPLQQACAPLLRVLADLPDSIEDLQHVLWLKEILKSEITRFTQLCDEINIPWKKMAIVRYCLCTALDEAAHSKTWGVATGWSQSNLLNYFENDNDGGNKFFLLIGRISMHPADYSDVLNILLRILGLGFEGRYSILPEGDRQLYGIRQRLLVLAENYQKTAQLPVIMGDLPGDPPLPARRFAVSWPNGLVVAVVILGAVWLAEKMVLFAEKQPLIAGIYALQNFRYPSPVTVSRLRLTDLLQEEIRNNLLTVNETPQQSHVTLQGDTSFRSGSALLSPATSHLLKKIAQQIIRVNGRVVIVGHTDALPVRYSAFPDNQQLSLQRAAAVARLFTQNGLEENNITVRGLADQQPVSSNSTVAGRAKNRRVELFVTY